MLNSVVSHKPWSCLNFRFILTPATTRNNLQSLWRSRRSMWDLLVLFPLENIAAQEYSSVVIDNFFFLSDFQFYFVIRVCVILFCPSVHFGGLSIEQETNWSSVSGDGESLQHSSLLFFPATVLEVRCRRCNCLIACSVREDFRIRKV